MVLCFCAVPVVIQWKGIVGRFHVGIAKRPPIECSSSAADKALRPELRVNDPDLDAAILKPSRKCSIT
jgi:hypothetical protein